MSSLKVSLITGAMLALSTTTTHARLSCSDPNYCFMNMPLYNQCDSSIGSYWLPQGGGNSMLCGPTSAAMAVAAVLNHKNAANPVSGWTSSSFRNASWQDRVRNESSLVGCSPTGGTMFYPLISWAGQGAGVAGRSGDFGWADGTTTWWNRPTDNGTFIGPLRAGWADTMVHGHYYKKVNNVLGTNYVTYSRNGGHFVAVSGHWYGDWLYINNPWGGINEWRNIQQLYSGVTWKKVGSFLGIPIYWMDTVTILPDGLGSQGYLHSSGDYYAIVEGYTGLTAW